MPALRLLQSRGVYLTANMFFLIIKTVFFRNFTIESERNMDCLIIGVAGGTGSGKTTFTNRLKEAFGDRISVIYYDNYYNDQRELSLEERKKVNYDHPDAFETDLLVEHLKALKNGFAVECPVYDYRLYTRSDETVTVNPCRVILLEGILVLHDPRLRELLDIKIFVDADADERILRRSVRDVQERGRDIEGIYKQYTKTVKPMHYLYVEPTKKEADIVINSGKNEVAFGLIAARIEAALHKN